GVLSILFMALGIVGFAARAGLKPEFIAESRRAETRGDARSPDVYRSIGEVVRAWRQWPVEPLAVVTTGILLLLATPFVSVVAVFIVFVLRGDRRYAGIAAVLIAALLVSVAFINR